MKIEFAETPKIQLLLGRTNSPAGCRDGVLRVGPSRYLIVGEEQPPKPAQFTADVYVVDLSPMFSTMEVIGRGALEFVANFASSDLTGSPHRAPTLLMSKFAEALAIIDMRGALSAKIHVHRSYAPYLYKLLSRSAPKS